MVIRLPIGDEELWGDRYNGFLRVEHNEDGTLKDVVRPSDLPYGAVYQALDIWDEFDSTGAAGSWNATTYAGWISGIDNLLAGEIANGDVVKADLGVASDGATHLFSYTAGDGPINVLIVSGQHGGETLAIWSCMRWFEQFATSNTLQMRQLRTAFRVTWIPNGNPARYRVSRVNPNDVDTNRNFNVLWPLYATNVGTGTYKGTAPESEAEVAIMATLIRSGNFTHVIDCHNYNPGADGAQHGLPGHHILGPRGFVMDSKRHWQALYGQGIAWTSINNNSTPPMLHNYANYYMRHVEGKKESSSMILEASANLLGSVSAQSVSRAGVRCYAGLIQTHLLNAMQNGFRATVEPYVWTLRGERQNQGTPTSVQAGGTVIDTETATNYPLSWTNAQFMTSEEPIARIPLISVPARVFVLIGGRYRWRSGSLGRYAVVMTLTRPDGTTVSKTISLNAKLADATVYEYFFASGSWWFDVPMSVDVLSAVEMTVQRLTGSGTLELYNLEMVLTVVPHVDEHMMPRFGVFNEEG